MCSGVSGMRQMWSSRVECRTVASSVRQAAGRSARIVRASSASSGRSTRWKPPSPASRKALPSAAASAERVQGLGERDVEGADPEGAGRGDRGERLGHRQAVQQAVDGADPQRVAGGVDEQDQAVVPGARRGVLVAQAQVGGPAVVAVGDQRLVGGEVGLDLREVGRVGERPQPVAETVLRGGGRQRFALDGALDDGGRAGRGAVAAVGQQQGFQVGGGGRASGPRGPRRRAASRPRAAGRRPRPVRRGRSAPMRPRWRMPSPSCS